MRARKNLMVDLGLINLPVFPELFSNKGLIFLLSYFMIQANTKWGVFGRTFKYPNPKLRKKNNLHHSLTVEGTKAAV